MGEYLKNAILAKESIICEARQHWVSLLPSGVIAILLLLFGASSDNTNSFWFMFIIAILVMAKPVIHFLTTELGCTNKRVIGKYGLVNTKSLDSPLNKVNNVSASSGLFGKILGYGNVKISTSAESYTYTGIANADQFKNELMKQIEQFEEDRIQQQAAAMASAMKNDN